MNCTQQPRDSDSAYVSPRVGGQEFHDGRRYRTCSASERTQRVRLKRNEVRFVGGHGRFRIYSFIWITHCQKQAAQRRAPGAPLRIHSGAVSHGAGWVSEWRTTLRASFSILGQPGIQIPRFAFTFSTLGGQFCKPVSFRTRTIQTTYMRTLARHKALLLLTTAGLLWLLAVGSGSLVMINYAHTPGSQIGRASCRERV